MPSFEKGFDLDTYTEEQSKASFRFYKDDIRNLCVELGVPREFRARNGTALSGEEGLCVLLKRLSYPNRLGDLSEIFGRSISELYRLCKPGIVRSILGLSSLSNDTLNQGPASI